MGERGGGSAVKGQQKKQILVGGIVHFIIGSKDTRFHRGHQNPSLRLYVASKKRGGVRMGMTKKPTKKSRKNEGALKGDRRKK